LVLSLLVVLVVAGCTPRGGRGGGGGGGDDDDSAGDDDDDVADDDDDDVADDDDDVLDDDDDDDPIDDDDAGGMDGDYAGPVNGIIGAFGKQYLCSGTGGVEFFNGSAAGSFSCDDTVSGILCAATFSGLEEGGSVDAVYDCYSDVLGSATLSISGGTLTIVVALSDIENAFTYDMVGNLELDEG
jgi:hypothetical protein